MDCDEEPVYAPVRAVFVGSVRKMAELLADAEFRNDVLVSLGVVFLEVIEQATPLADQHEQTPPGSVILLMRLKVLRQLGNSLAENCDLHFRTTRISRMRAIVVDDGFLLLSG
jgi:hypothetical protein